MPLLSARGHDVTAAGRASARLGALAQTGATTLSLDLFDETAVRHALADQEVIINLATHVPPNSRVFVPGAWKEMDRIRREASAIIANAAAACGVRRYIQESFAAIYPDNGDRWITEAVLPKPARYNRSVVDAEASVARFAETGGAGVVLRFAFLYGVNDPFTRQLTAMVRTGWLPLLGRRGAYFPMVLHEDVATAVVAALDIPTGIYNVVDDRPMTREAIGEAVAGMLGVRPPRIFPAWLAMLGGSLGTTLARSLRVSNAKLKSATRWIPDAPSVVDGLRRAIASNH